MNKMKKFFAWMLCLYMFGAAIGTTTMPVAADTMVYVTKTGAKYHAGACGRGSYYQATLSSAKARGLTPCEKCFPGGEPAEATASVPTTPTTTQAAAVDTPTTSQAQDLKLNVKEKEMVIGQTYRLKVKNTSEKVTWKATKPDIVKVSKNGTVEAKKPGRTSVKATVAGKTLKCIIEVVKPELSSDEEYLYVGESTKLKVTRHKTKVKWKTSNKAVVTVDQTGKIKAKKKGKATITATVNQTKLKCRVEVLKDE